MDTCLILVDPYLQNAVKSGQSYHRLRSRNYRMLSNIHCSLIHLNFRKFGKLISQIYCSLPTISRLKGTKHMIKDIIIVHSKFMSRSSGHTHGLNGNQKSAKNSHLVVAIKIISMITISHMKNVVVGAK